MNASPDTQAQGMPDLSSAISKIMEHPELISMVASVLGNDGAQSAQSDSEGGDTASGAVSAEAAFVPPPEVISTLAPVLSKISALSGGASGSRSFKHEALLCALKPYLSRSRVDAIDYIVKISKMSSLIQGLK